MLYLSAHKAEMDERRKERDVEMEERRQDKEVFNLSILTSIFVI